MKISLENYLRNKLDEVESMHSFELATDTLRCWIDEYNNNETSKEKHSEVLNIADVMRSLPLVEALEQYIGVLGEELDELASMATTHGWKSSRVEIGEQLRNRIAELKRQ